MRTWIGLFLLATVTTATDARAQSDADVRGAVLQGANLGDRITVTLRDGAEMRGRLVDTKDGLTLRHDRDHRTFNFADIDTVSRQKNGMILGPVIGAAAGLSLGLPLRSRMNNEARDGDKGLAVLVVTGVAIGTLLDALIGSDRTIYRRTGSPPGFTLAPTHGGVTARWQRTW
jgi:hypothetical protein